MILDNQVVPDIIVSVEGGLQNGLYNINNNCHHLERLISANYNGHSQVSPRPFVKEPKLPWLVGQIPKQSFTGNNNGSPRHTPHSPTHIPHNGNNNYNIKLAEAGWESSSHRDSSLTNKGDRDQDYPVASSSPKSKEGVSFKSRNHSERPKASGRLPPRPLEQNLRIQPIGRENSPLHQRGPENENLAPNFSRIPTKLPRSPVHSNLALEASRPPSTNGLNAPSPSRIPVHVSKTDQKCHGQNTLQNKRISNGIPSKPREAEGNMDKKNGHLSTHLPNGNLPLTSQATIQTSQGTIQASQATIQTTNSELSDQNPENKERFATLDSLNSSEIVGKPSPEGNFSSSSGSSSSATSSGNLWSSVSGRKAKDRLVNKNLALENDVTSSFQMVLIKCKDTSYLTRLFVNNEGIHGLRVVGRVGVGGSASGHMMNLDQPAGASHDLLSNQKACKETLIKGNDVIPRDMLSDCVSSSQVFDTEFEHEVADYQWLLDYEYRESYCRDYLGGQGRDGGSRVSILLPGDRGENLSYESISRNIDANLAEIDMDDFRSEDMNQFLVAASGTYADTQSGEIYRGGSPAVMTSSGMLQGSSCFNQQQLHQKLLQQQLLQQWRDDLGRSQAYKDEGEDELGGDISLYQSGPLFSPLRDPMQLPPSFSIDSLDNGSMHEDLILTCQANKDNYTIAFEGSFVHFSDGSDYETGNQNTTGSGGWSGDCLQPQKAHQEMSHSDQPFTTWSNVSRRSSQSQPDDSSQSQEEQQPAPESSEAKSSSLPNLMKRSLEVSARRCVKVFDLQNSLRTNHFAQSAEGNNFSLMRLFMKQKKVSKEAVSISSSCTDPSQEGVTSSSENHSGVNDSSDWPMNSQSENDMDRSASPMPVSTTNNHLIHDHGFRIAGNSPNIMAMNQGFSPTAENHTSNYKSNSSSSNTERSINNNNIDNIVDNVYSNGNASTEEINTCSVPPLPSPIREEPEGMDVSVDCKRENQVILQQSETEVAKQIMATTKGPRIQQNELNSCRVAPNGIVQTNTEGIQNSLSVRDDKRRSRSPALRNSIQRTLRDSEKPKPVPRSLRLVADECIQTSNLKVSATVNTSGFLEKKEVYVYYPNYALPDLGFLKDKKYITDSRVFLVPQRFIEQQQEARLLRDKRSRRPFSCGDMEKLRMQEFSHVKDWDSLNFLLPKELKEILNNTDCMDTPKPSFCNSPKLSRRCVSSSSQKTTEDVKDSKASSSSQPSSGYRGSSTILNDSNDSSGVYPRYVNRPSTGDSSQVFGHGPPEDRPSPLGSCDNGPLPRGILRKCTSLKEDPLRQETSFGQNIRHSNKDKFKRRSLQEPVYVEDLKERANNLMCCSCENDCTGFCAEGLRTKNLLRVNELPEVSCHEELTDADVARLRTHVSDLLVNKGDSMGLVLTNNLLSSCNCPRKSVSFAERDCAHHRPQDTELLNKKSKKSKEAKHRTGEGNSCSGRKPDEDIPPMLYDFHDKKTLVLSVRVAVEKLVNHFNAGTTAAQKNELGNSDLYPEVADLALEKLCPAIYALLSDGLLPSLHSLFGKIPNSVWKVVEATSQMGASTKALNDLVMTLNSEDGLSEGPIKFNAFVFGLLNIRSVNAWLGYLRTRESTLQKHYHPESLLYLSNTAMKGLFDDLLVALRPLALLPFHLDLLHEYKALHASLLMMEERLALHSSQASSKAIHAVAKQSKELINVATRTTNRQRSPRPRSCHENTEIKGTPGALKKRWSGVQLGSKFTNAIDRLMNEDDQSSEDYTDSIDNPCPPYSDALSNDAAATAMKVSDGNLSLRSITEKDSDTEKGFVTLCGESESEGEKFRRLQLKWEKLALRGNHRQKPSSEEFDPSDRSKSVSPGNAPRSRIPRPVSITSPLQSFKPFEPSKEKLSPQVKPSNYRKAITPPVPKDFKAPKNSLRGKIYPTDHRGPFFGAKVAPWVSTTTRASSVPGRNHDRESSGTRGDGLRQGVSGRSSSHGRKGKRNQEERLVQTLHHRLATDNGHLSFSRGDVLAVIVEVDDRFLLCCHHDRKGLVPKTSVIPFQFS